MPLAALSVLVRLADQDHQASAETEAAAHSAATRGHCLNSGKSLWEVEAPLEEEEEKEQQEEEAPGEDETMLALSVEEDKKNWMQAYEVGGEQSGP